MCVYIKKIYQNNVKCSSLKEDTFSAVLEMRVLRHEYSDCTCFLLQ